MSKFKVYVTDGRHASYDIERQMLAEIGADLEVLNCVTPADIAQQCADADAILLDMAPMNAEAISALKHCKIINRYGVGYDNVDIHAAAQAEIYVTNVPDYCAEDVSDHAIAMMLASLRSVAYRDRCIRDGKWNLQRQSFRLKGKTLGLLGFGRISKTVAQKCGCFGFEKIMAYDPYLSDEVFTSRGVIRAEMDEVLKNAGFLSLHMPVTDETRGIIDGEKLALMKPTAILVNTGRGVLINDDALIDALRNNRLLHAALDTHTMEPLPIDSPYFQLDNVTLTDHTAYSTAEGVIELKTKSAQHVVDALLGKVPEQIVNGL